jgi:hypothetical protein
METPKTQENIVDHANEEDDGGGKPRAKEVEGVDPME